MKRSNPGPATAPNAGAFARTRWLAPSHCPLPYLSWQSHMSFLQSPLAKNLETASKIMSNFSKFGILVGGACVISYSLRINYFPQDLTVGDGLLFILAAACFGMIYAFFVGGLICIGITLSPILRWIVRLVTKAISWRRKRDHKPTYELAPFQWIAPLYAVAAVFLILAFGRRDPSAYWNLPTLSITLYVFYSIYLSSGKKIREIEALKNQRIYTEAKENAVRIGDIDKLRGAQVLSLLTVLLLPLILGGVFGQLLDATMRAAHVRIEKAVLYVKEPYSTIIPQSLTSKTVVSPRLYTAFEGAIVLFKGFGKTTIVSFSDGTMVKKLEIPNEDIIIGDSLPVH